MAKFREYRSDPQWLFPLRPGELVPDDDIVWFIDAVVDRLDLTSIENQYSELGSEGYSPRLMLKLLVYGYSQGILSTRKLERLACREAGGIVLAGGQRPDHSTISRFRKQFAKEIADLFYQVLSFCVEEGMVAFGELYLDGSKIRANASKRKANSAKRLDEKLAKLREEVDELMAEAESINNLEDELYGSKSDTAVPDAIAEKTEQIKRFDSYLGELQKRADLAGKKLDPKNQINFTDPESRIMKTSNDGFQQCYNAQAVVDPKCLVIVAADVTQEVNDRRQLIPMCSKAQSNLGTPITTIVADAGYYSIDNLAYCVDSGIDAYIPVNKDVEKESKTTAEKPSLDLGAKKRLDKDCFEYDAEKDVFRCPMGTELKPAKERQGKKKLAERHYYSEINACKNCEHRTKCIRSKKGYRTITRHQKEFLSDDMKEKLKTEEGKEIYSKRKYKSEPVFGLQKFGMKFRQFSRRGLEAARNEYGFVSMVHNIKRMWHHCRLGQKPTELEGE